MTEFDCNFDLNIYEINTDEKFSVLYGALLINCPVILFFFDVTKKQSYSSVKEVIKKIEKKAKEQKVTIILVGNKIDDQESREVSLEEIQSFLEKRDSIIKYIEISVKTKLNLADVLRSIFTSLKSNNELKGKKDRGSTRDFTIYESEKSNKTNCLYVKTVYKIILLGDGEVGKSSFFKRYFFDDFEENYMLTMGVNDKYKFIKINDNEIKMQLWDTAGQERFRSLPRKYYQHADGIILIYDVTNRVSFNNVTKWLKDISDNTRKKLIIYLVGNKIDLIGQRKVEYSEALELSLSHKIKVMEISCKLDVNVTEAMMKISQDIYEESLINNNNIEKSFSLMERDNKGRSCCSGRK